MKLVWINKAMIWLRIKSVGDVHTIVGKFWYKIWGFRDSARTIFQSIPIIISIRNCTRRKIYPNTSMILSFYCKQGPDMDIKESDALYSLLLAPRCHVSRCNPSYYNRYRVSAHCGDKYYHNKKSHIVHHRMIMQV